MIVVDVLTPTIVSDEEAEIRSLLNSASPKARELAESLLASRPSPPFVGSKHVCINFWSGPSHERFAPAVPGRLTKIGTSYKLCDFEQVAHGCGITTTPSVRCYVAKWPKLFKCDAVIPDLRAVFCEVTVDASADFELRNFRMRIIKCATSQAARWHSIYEQSLTSSSQI